MVEGAAVQEVALVLLLVHLLVPVSVVLLLSLAMLKNVTFRWWHVTILVKSHATAVLAEMLDVGGLQV
jgi:hypothetical protein